MKKYHIILSLLAAVVVFSVVFTACQKSNNNPSDTISAQDDLTLQASATVDDESDNAYNDVTNNVLGVNDDAGIGTGIGVFLTAPHTSNGTPVNQFGDGEDSVGHCYKITSDPDRANTFPKTITIDFGSGCTGKDGHTRRGKIITVYTGHMRDAGSSATTTFDGFYIDSIKVEGTLSIQNNSTSSGLVFTVTITNGKLSDPSGDYAEINRTRTWTQTAGSSTPHDPIDDIYSITGSSSGTAQVLGITIQWTSTITTPVVRKMTCRWAVSGQVTITRSNKTAVLDYGNGDCDNQATVTVGSKVHNITLH